MNCCVFETAQSLILVDCGVYFSDLTVFGVQFQMPDLSYVLERKEKFRGFVLTHAHEDHIGALPYAFTRGLEAPIYASHFTGLLVQERLEAFDPDIQIFEMGRAFNLGDFRIEAHSVNHSIIDAAALFIDTPAGRVIHTGDFRIDPQPFVGSMMDLKTFGKAGEQGVRLLLSDSTNAELDADVPSESTLIPEFESLLAEAHGLSVIALFASNAGRIGQILSIAKRTGRFVAIAGRTMQRNLDLAIQAGYLSEGLECLISLSDISQKRRKDVMVLTTGSQGEHRSALAKMATGEFEPLRLTQDDQVIFSSKQIPGNERTISRLMNALVKQGAKVIHDAIEHVHVSGHASRPQLEEMIRLTQPSFVLPVHGEWRQLVRHAEIVRELKVGEPFLAENGDVLELSSKGLERVEVLPETRVLIERRLFDRDFTKDLLKSRRLLAEKGILFVAVVVEQDSGMVLSGPILKTKGLISQKLEPELRRVLLEVADQTLQKAPLSDLEEALRMDLKRAATEKLGHKVLVVAVVHEV
jgi:ribonuclease J